METYTGLEIAVIGISGRFPGAEDTAQFWENLKNGVESIRLFSEEEMISEGESAALIRKASYVPAGAYLENKDCFDAAFFKYRPAEAALMDPQMRIFHECVWQALEDAGCISDDNENMIGLFATASHNINWQVYAQVANMKAKVDDFSVQQLSNVNFMASRTAYALNLHGPAIFMDTACSSSLVAIHEARKSLLLGDCYTAVAGGVAVTNRLNRGYVYQEGMITSKDGHCRAFDKEASGTVSGEGAALVVLKTLKNALKDGDHIYALIKGSSINNDGRNKVGFTAPSIEGQAEVISKAQKWAGVTPQSISYVEAHGTATKLGDPVEVEALKLAFGKSDEPYCAIGSVKTNIGHLDTVAGAAGILKTILALKNRQLPPSLHFKNWNPQINVANCPFYVNAALQEWKNDCFPLRAGVSSFGIGGTNAHLILEEAPPQPSKSKGRDYQLLLFSAATPAALQRNLFRFRDHLQTVKKDDFPDIAYTLQRGRKVLGYKKALVCKDIAEAIKHINSDEKSEDMFEENVRPQVAFMFPGQGSQYYNMGRDLYLNEPFFKEVADKCFLLIKGFSGIDMRPALFEEKDYANPERINNTMYTQPLLFLVEYALAQLLINWGIRPDVMIGHSIGEYVAACISGVFSLEDAVRIVVKRGALMQQMPAGQMLSVAAPSSSIMPILKACGKISLATVNSTTSCVVSGNTEEITEFKKMAENAGYRTNVVRTSHAFHSYMMDDILSEFEKEFSEVAIGQITIPFISNLSGAYAILSEVTQARYWSEQLRNTVQFAKGIDLLLKTDRGLFLEVGPGRVLSAALMFHAGKGSGHKTISLMRSLNEVVNDQEFLLSGIGKLWLCNISPNWESYYKYEDRRKVSLPAYSFEKVIFPTIVDAAKLVSKNGLKQTIMADISHSLHTFAWEIAPELPCKEDPSRGIRNFLFIDDFGVGVALLKMLNRLGQDVVVINKGEDYRSWFDQYTDVEDIRIIYSWCITGDQTETDLVLDVSFYHILDIVKSLSQLEGKKNVEIIGLTDCMCKVLPTDKPVTGKSVLSGAFRVIPKEYRNINCRQIDFVLDEADESAIRLLYHEIISGTDAFIALRHQVRFVEMVRPFIAPLVCNSELPFKAGLAYLVTGGTGAMGLSFMRNIASRFKKIIFMVVGRKALPDQSAWSAWIKDNTAEDPLYDIVRELSLIKALGAQIHYHQVDIADAPKLKSEIALFEEAAGRIRGVLHTAGVPDYGGVIHRRNDEETKKVFKAKIFGTQSLSAALEKNHLDFFLLCSSADALYAPFGQVGYVAANLFMNAFAANNHRTGKNIVSVGWNTWKDAGMAARMEMDTIGTPLGITADEGFEILSLALVAGVSNILISAAALHGRCTDFSGANTPTVGSELILENTNDVVAKKMSIPVKDWLIEYWKDFFGKSTITENDDFFELGGDSLKVMTMILHIKEVFRVDLPMTFFFDYPCIKDLSLLIEQMQEQQQATV